MRTINSEFIVLGVQENTKVVAEFYKDCTNVKLITISLQMLSLPVF